jgi:hypothetical protein
VRRALVAIALAAAALAVPAHAAVPDDFYGINGQWVFQSPQGTWPKQFSSIANGGLTSVRTDARWSVAEPDPPSASGQHTYDWSTYDTIVGTLAKYGLRWMPTLDYPPPWAQEDPTERTQEDPNGLGSEMKEANTSDFVAFAAAMVRRYGIDGTFWSAHPELPAMPVRVWEIWNSPNVTYYWNPQDNAPERFADLYLATRTAMKAVNDKAVVMAGALDLVNPPIASDEVKFIKRMFAHRPEVRTNVDLWGLHPYQETIYWTFRRLAKWRQALDLLNGRRMPIAIDELGYTTTKVSDQMRGDELVELAQELPRSGCDVMDFMPYSWESSEQDSNNPEDWFGIWNHDGTPKPSGQRFVDAVLQMRGLSPTPGPSDQLNLCGPGIKLGVRRKRGLIELTVRCPQACRLDAYLMTRRLGKHSKLRTQAVRHARQFSTRARTLTFRVPAHASNLRPDAELVLVAFDRSGTSSRTTRKVRLR